MDTKICRRECDKLVNNDILNQWENASPTDEFLLSAIKKLFKTKQHFVNFMFHPSEAKLAFASEEIIEMAMGLGSGYDLLVRISLDIWSGEGGINFNEIYQKLDTQNFNEVVSVLQMLHRKQFSREEVF